MIMTRRAREKGGMGNSGSELEGKSIRDKPAPAKNNQQNRYTQPVPTRSRALNTAQASSVSEYFLFKFLSPIIPSVIQFKFFPFLASQMEYFPRIQQG